MKETGPSYDQKCSCSDNPRQNTRDKIEKSSKIGNDKKSLISTIVGFLLLPKIHLKKVNGALGYASTLIWNIFLRS